MGKYSSFGRRLDGDKVELTFKEVEEILGFPLPESAYKYRPWWANDQTHVQSRDGWLGAGYEVDFVELRKERVVFKRALGGSSREDSNRPLDYSDVRDSRTFEDFAGEVMSSHFGETLRPGKTSDNPKLFDYVSPDRKIVGDAKYLTMVRGVSIPPAKFSVIAEHVWLLGNTKADGKFLVFGNDRRVPEEWLKRYGHLVTDVEFYFLGADGKPFRLN